MRRLIICDKNPELIKAVEELLKKEGFGVFDDVQAICGDVIEVHEKTPNSRIVTASNPDFSPDGGLDKLLSEKYEWNAREFAWNDDLFFIKSVGQDRRSSKEILLRAAVGILGYSHNFVPILTGVGTGIGGVAISVFIEALKAVLDNLSSANLRWADLSSADLRSANLSSADLSWANLRWANLSSANLSSANLSSADLRWADLSSADLNITEFDGLTVNEFIKKYKLETKGTKVYLYKGVTENLSSPVNGKKKYEVGKIVREKLCSFSVSDTCKNGLHVLPTIEKCSEYGSKVIKVEVDMGDFVAIPNQDGKVRVKKLKVIEIIK